MYITRLQARAKTIRDAKDNVLRTFYVGGFLKFMKQLWLIVLASASLGMAGQAVASGGGMGLEVGGGANAGFNMKKPSGGDAINTFGITGDARYTVAPMIQIGVKVGETYTNTTSKND